jgi:hypothetical protein
MKAPLRNGAFLSDMAQGPITIQRGSSIKKTPGRTSDRVVSAARFLGFVFVGGSDTCIVTFAALKARDLPAFCLHLHGFSEDSAAARHALRLLLLVDPEARR